MAARPARRLQARQAPLAPAPAPGPVPVAQGEAHVTWASASNLAAMAQAWLFLLLVCGAAAQSITTSRKGPMALMGRGASKATSSARSKTPKATDPAAPTKARSGSKTPKAAAKAPTKANMTSSPRRAYKSAKSKASVGGDALSRSLSKLQQLQQEAEMHNIAGESSAQVASITFAAEARRFHQSNEAEMKKLTDAIRQIHHGAQIAARAAALAEDAELKAHTALKKATTDAARPIVCPAELPEDFDGKEDECDETGVPKCRKGYLENPVNRPPLKKKPWWLHKTQQLPDDDEGEPIPALGFFIPPVRSDGNSSNATNTTGSRRLVDSLTGPRSQVDAVKQSAASIDAAVDAAKCARAAAEEARSVEALDA